MNILGAIGGQIAGGIASGIGGLASGAFDKLGDIAGTSQLARSAKVDYQNKLGLMREQGQINDHYAQKAFERQKEFYEQTLKDNSPEARRRRLEEAGLSVGLMASGAAGGIGTGSGGISQTAVGSVGQPGSIGMGLGITPTERASVAKTAAETELLKAEAEKLRQESKTEDEQRQYLLEELRQTGIAKWIANELRKFYLENNKDDDELKDFFQEWRNERLEDKTHFKPDNTESREKYAEILLTQAKAEEAAGNANAARAAALLTNEKTKWYFLEMQTALLQGNAAYAQAMAAKTAAEANATRIAYETGEEWNWKTVVDYGFKTAGLAIDAYSAGKKGVIAGKWLEQGQQQWEAEMTQRMEEAADRRTKWELEEEAKRNAKTTVYRDAKGRKTGSKTTF